MMIGLNYDSREYLLPLLWRLQPLFVPLQQYSREHEVAMNFYDHPPLAFMWLTQQPTCQPACLPMVSPSGYLPMYLSIYRPMYLSVYLST